MSYGDFPEVLFVKAIDASESPLLGGFLLTTNSELLYINLHIYINGLLPTTETMQLQVHSDSTCSSLLFASDTVNVNAIENISSSVIGTIRFTFDRQNLSNQYYYYLKLILNNYTGNNTNYISTIIDWPDETNVTVQSNITKRPMKFEILGYER